VGGNGENGIISGVEKKMRVRMYFVDPWVKLKRMEEIAGVN